MKRQWLIISGIIFSVADCATPPVTTMPLSNQVSMNNDDKPPLNQKNEVIHDGRYLLVDITPLMIQRRPLSQIIDITIPGKLSPTVGETINYLLSRSGYAFCQPDSQLRYLLSKPLPLAHYRLGPMHLSEALEILAGPAWQLAVDEANRTVCYKLIDDNETPNKLAPESAHQIDMRAEDTFLKSPSPNLALTPRAATAQFYFGGIDQRAGKIYAVIAPANFNRLDQLHFLSPGDYWQGWRLVRFNLDTAHFRKGKKHLTLHATH